MAVDQYLIEGSKDLLFQDYLDINVPLSSAQTKEALQEAKPKRTYKKKPSRKYNSNGKPKATVRKKSTTRKKYEKAS